MEFGIDSQQIKLIKRMYLAEIYLLNPLHLM